MSNNPVDTEQSYQTKPPVEEGDEPSPTLAAFRIRSDAVEFHKRMAQYFFDCHLIPEPKLSLLAKACLNIVAHKYAKLEEDALASWIHRLLLRYHY
jgi:hypothetical protein